MNAADDDEGRKAEGVPLSFLTLIYGPPLTYSPLTQFAAGAL